MNNQSNSINNRSVTGDIISCIFAIGFIAIGLINIFWGNDTGYGMFIFFLAFLFFPALTDLIRKHTNLSFPLIAKVLLALFIIWSALGVGELFHKIEMMKGSF